MKKIIFATHNEHKLTEVRAILEPLGYKVLSAGDLNLPDVEETGTTFKDNALLKAYEGQVSSFSSGSSGNTGSSGTVSL